MADDQRVSLFDDSEDGSVSTEQTEPRRKRLRDRWLLLSVVGLLVLLLGTAAGVVGWYGKSIYDALDSVDRQPSMLPSDNRPSPVATPDGEDHEPMNLVLMGTDQRAGETARGRSDVLMILHIPANRKKVYIISVPRDYWVSIPGRGTAKINAAYSWGGPALTLATLESLLDVPMDHVALINFEGFVEVIDTLGGVTVYNRHDSTIDGTHFPVGEVQLDGQTALKFVRNRYGLPNGDLDRAERQRDVIKAVIEKLVSADVLTDPVRFNEAIVELGSQFTVDDTFTNQEIVDLGLSMRITGGSDVVSLQAPTAGFGTSSDGQSYVAVDTDGLADLAEALRNDTMDAFAGSQ